MNSIKIDRSIRTRKQSQCSICGSAGKLIYKSLDDKLYNAPGLWDLKKCQNSNCGLVWLDPMPFKEDLPKLYMNYYTHADQLRANSKTKDFYQKVVDAYLSTHYGYYNQSAHKFGLMNILGMLIHFHPERSAAIDCSIMGLKFQNEVEQKNTRLLEIGCGDGKRLQTLASLGWLVEGIDFDQAAVKNAEAKGLKVTHGDIFAQNYPDNSFDVLVSSHVIEHVPDPVAFFQECHRILKTGGKMVHYTPNIDSFGHKKYQDNWRGLEPPRHLHLFSIDALNRVVNNSGFRIVQCDTTGRGANTLLDSYYLKQSRGLGPDKTGFGKRILFEYFSWLSFVLRKVNNKWGEELVVNAIK